MKQKVKGTQVEEILKDQLAKLPEMMGREISKAAQKKSESAKQKSKFESELRKQVIKHSKILLIQKFHPKSATIQAQKEELKSAIKLRAPSDYSNYNNLTININSPFHSFIFT